MNLILLTKKEEISPNKYEVFNHKFLHLKNVLKVSIDQKVVVGQLDGLIGYGIVKEIKNDSIVLISEFCLKPPAPAPITLVLALPRPKMLKRILRNISMLGVKEIYLINSYKVEKSFWKSRLLIEEEYEKYFIQGLEQSKDTVMPKLYLKNRFKPFVEDEIPDIIKGSSALVAHPGDYPSFPQAIEDPLTLAIGPEGGFTDYEVEKFEEVGFRSVHCGSRILRMETAVVALISQHSSFLK